MMLDKAAVIREYEGLSNALGVNPTQMVLTGGSAMVMLGLRERTADLDIQLDQSVFDKLVSEPWAAPTDGLLGTPYMEFNSRVELIRAPKPGPQLYQFVADRVPTVCLAELLHQKRRMAAHPDRKPEKVPQDQADIVKLTEALVKVL